MSDLHGQRIREITDYMFLPDCPVAADATIVLGQTLWHRPFQKSVEIYKAGAAGKIIFTGGFNPKLGSCEALRMRRTWGKLGYSANDVLTDIAATNTLENMQNARALMSGDLLLKDCKAINIITINYHMRRAVETLKHVFADASIQIGIVNYPSRYCGPDTWFADQTGRTLVMSELAKIRKYLSPGQGLDIGPAHDLAPHALQGAAHQAEIPASNSAPVAPQRC